MTRSGTLRRATAIALTLAIVPAAHAATPLAVTPNAVTPHAVTLRDALPRDATNVTMAELTASNAKIASAYGHLARTWNASFDAIGAQFALPSLVRYRTGARSACGVMRQGNAGYCIRDNTIYYDELFVAAQAGNAARQLGTDGDMAAVGIIAHEVGHAVAMQLGHLSRFTYDNEQVADCLAGSFARQADADGMLEPGDIEEAFFGMATAGDPTPRLTGDDRVDRSILTRASRMGHGTEQQRTDNFRAGLRAGAGACLREFR